MLLIQSILIRLFERLLCHVGMNTLLTLDRGDHCSDYCDIVHLLINNHLKQSIFILITGKLQEKSCQFDHF